jgi:hypothetical protein
MKSSYLGPESWPAYCTAAIKIGEKSSEGQGADQFPMIGIPT